MNSRTATRTPKHRSRGLAFVPGLPPDGTALQEQRNAIGNLAALTVTPGDVVLIPPGCRQRITGMGNEDLVFLAICTPRFRPEAYEDIDPDPVPTSPALA
jgi:hypothetical protein